MGIFDKLNKTKVEDAPANLPVVEKIEIKKEEDRELGAANRYMNGSEEFQERINNEAVRKVNQLMPVLADLESNPKLFNFHDSRIPRDAGHLGNYIFDFKVKDLDELYGAQTEYINEHYNPSIKVPQEVVSFMRRVQDLKNKYAQDSNLFNA